MQGQSSVLYFQPRSATPSERLFAAAHRERERRIESAAHRITVKPVPAVAAAVEHRNLLDIETPEQWAERQKQKHQTKEPWFSIVADVTPLDPPRPLIAEIITVTARYYGVTRADIISARRTANVVLPRHVVYYLAKKLTLRSLPEIARHIGQRDHTSILSGVRKITRLIVLDAKLASDVASLEADLMQGSGA